MLEGNGLQMGRMLACLCVCCLFQNAASPASAQRNYYEEARAKYQAKQYREALNLADQALRGDENNPAKLDLYGTILAAVEQYYLAEESLRKAVSLAPDQATFQYDLGALLHQEKKYREAVPVLKRAVELDPENLTARMMLARSYVFSYHELQIPNFAELTLEQLNYIVKKNPQFPRVHHHIALVYINSGEPAKAVEELNTELKDDPSNSQARLELGETLLKLNQYHKATEELLVAARQAPQVPDIQYALAKAYKSEDHTEKALDAARKCVELNPQFANGHYLLGVLYRDSNQPELARQQFELFQQLKGTNAPPQ
jgi:tetratricopeptide (TPR) repeat protein